MRFAIDFLREFVRAFAQLETRPRRTAIAATATIGFGLVLLCWSWVGWFRSPSSARHGLRGRVEYAGAPLQLGEVCLELIADPLLSRPAAPVIDGAFEIPPQRGLILNERYRVLVVGYQAVAQSAGQSRASSTEAAVDPQMMIEYEQVIPTRHNSESNLIFDATGQNLRQGLTLRLE
jgi:hypothetical protein